MSLYFPTPLACCLFPQFSASSAPYRVRSARIPRDSHGSNLARMTLPRKTYRLASCFNRETETKMRNGKRGRNTLEFKQEAVRLVESGQTLAAAARNSRSVHQLLS